MIKQHNEFMLATERKVRLTSLTIRSKLEHAEKLTSLKMILQDFSCL